jgi:hypothetical protein
LQGPRRSLALLAGTLASDHEAPEDRAEQQRQSGQQHQYDHPVGDGAVGRAMRRTLTRALAARDQVLERGGTPADSVDQLLAGERG